MIKQDELAGIIVLVRPDLLNDPEDNKNRIGTVLSADVLNDDVIIGFGDGTLGLFSFDALLVLRNIDDIRRSAEFDFTLMPREDYYDITEVCFLAGLSDPAGRRAAVELAQKSPMALEYAMRPLSDELGLDQHKTIRR